MMKFLTAFVTISGIVAINWFVSRDFTGFTAGVFYIVSLFLIVAVGSMALMALEDSRKDDNSSES